MSTARQLRSEIIKIIKDLNDVEALASIRHQLEIVHRAKSDEPSPAFLEAVTTIRKDVSLKEIMAEQHYKPVTYEAFRKIADEIEWEESLDELLEALKN
jgi:transketolase